MDNLTVLLVDDEPLARSRLRRLLDGVPAVTVIGEAADGSQAVSEVKRLQPDIVFLDIQMPVCDGIQAAKKITALSEPQPAIIFCTAYDQYGLAAIKASAIDYLLKPVSSEDLNIAIQRAQKVSKSQLHRLSNVWNQRSSVFDRTESVVSRLESGLLKTPINEIAYFKSADKLVYATTTAGKEVVVDVILKELIERFPHELLRIHRNCVVNVNQLERLLRLDSGKDVVTLRDSEHQLEVSRRQLAEVKRWFKN